MVGTVAVGLDLADVVLLLHHLIAGFLAQAVDQVINIFDKARNNADANSIANNLKG